MNQMANRFMFVQLTCHLMTVTLASQIAQGVMISAILRNRQCLLAFVNRRNRMLMEMRWNLGAVVPEDTRYRLSFMTAIATAAHRAVTLVSLAPLSSGRSLPLTSSHSSPNMMA